MHLDTVFTQVDYDNRELLCKQSGIVYNYKDMCF